jgi:hypothetical protein
MAHPGFFDSIGRDLTGPGMFGGKFQIRLILQPVLAMILGVRIGIRDAREGKEPFFSSLAHAKGNRGELIGRAARDAIIPLLLALLIDSILQHMINGRVRPVASLIVGGLLVFLPFLIVRALANRAWRHGHAGAPAPARRAGRR